jgi:hypothetical protein
MPPPKIATNRHSRRGVAHRQLRRSKRQRNGHRALGHFTHEKAPWALPAVGLRSADAINPVGPTAYVEAYAPLRQGGALTQWSSMPNALTIELLQQEAVAFAKAESLWPEPSLFGVTDGKAVGTYLEQKFQACLQTRYAYDRGNAAKGIDFPGLDVDIKTTSIRQPQSSCPFKNARQKIYGLGYSLLIFVYEKTDNQESRTGLLNILHTIFVSKDRTADHSMSVALRRMIEDGANSDDILSYFEERNLPIDEFECEKLAAEIITSPPQIGYLTISNARQWRLQYKRVINKAGAVEGILRLS